MRLLFFASLLLLCLSCHRSQKFDKIKWAETSDLMTFPNRKYMIIDLLETYHLKGKSYNEVLDLLGEPQSKLDQNKQAFYDIDVTFGSDIDPVYTKILLLSFDKDSIVESIKINEWKK